MKLGTPRYRAGGDGQEPDHDPVSARQDLLPGLHATTSVCGSSGTTRGLLLYGKFNNAILHMRAGMGSRHTSAEGCRTVGQGAAGTLHRGSDTGSLFVLERTYPAACGQIHESRQDSRTKEQAQ